MSTKSLYELLDTRPEASAAELRRDYERALAAANRSGATKHMVTLVEAYEVLSDPHRRAKYDATGRSVPPQHIGNPYGRQVPFRSDRPGLGQHRRRSVPAPSVVPSVPISSGSTAKGVALTLSVFIAAGGVVAAVVALRSTPAPSAHVVPGRAGSQTLVICPNARFWESAGVRISCADGSAPVWGATRVR